MLIAAERKGQTARQAFAGIGAQVGGEDVAISVVTLIELAHGVARADTDERKAMRQQFVDELMMGLPVHPVSVAVARGVRLALADLLIGVTALELGYRVATTNVRHFAMVPRLEIVAF